MAKKKKQQVTTPYHFKASDGVTYILTGVHNKDGNWFYDLKDENGKHYYNISCNKIKEYL